jgi:hypothetical protein
MPDNLNATLMQAYVVAAWLIASLAAVIMGIFCS